MKQMKRDTLFTSFDAKLLLGTGLAELVLVGILELLPQYRMALVPVSLTIITQLLFFSVFDPLMGRIEQRRKRPQ